MRLDPPEGCEPRQRRPIGFVLGVGLRHHGAPPFVPACRPPPSEAVDIYITHYCAAARCSRACVIRVAASRGRAGLMKFFGLGAVFNYESNGDTRAFSLAIRPFFSFCSATREYLSLCRELFRCVRERRLMFRAALLV